MHDEAGIDERLGADATGAGDPDPDPDRRASRRRFLAGGAALAAGGAALVQGILPADASGPSLFSGSEPEATGTADGIGAAALPTRYVGTTMKTVNFFGFRAIGVSPGTSMIQVGSLGVYSNGGEVGTILEVPVGSTLLQIDCYGVRSTAGTQSWGLIYATLDTATAPTLVQSAVSESGTGVLRATLSPFTTVGAGKAFAVGITTTSAESLVRGIVYQYGVLGYVPVTPFRAYDSRWAGFPGPLANSNRVVPVKDARNQTTGVVTTADVVPAGASAVTFNLTVAETVGQGFLSVAPGDAVSSGSSTINWSATGQVLANASSVNLDPGRNVKVFAGGGGATQFVIDVTGYYI